MNHGIQYKFILSKMNELELFYWKNVKISSPYSYFDLFELIKRYLSISDSKCNKIIKECHTFSQNMIDLSKESY